MGQFPNCEIKLCDLEVARVIQDEEDIREIIGTPDYVGKSLIMFPETSVKTSAQVRLKDCGEKSLKCKSYNEFNLIAESN